MTRALLFWALLLTSCAGVKKAVDWEQPRPGQLAPPASHERALDVACRVYGVDFRVTNLTYLYVVPTCDIVGVPASRTPKGACVQGALQFGGYVGLAWVAGMRHSESGFCDALWQAREAIVSGTGYPDVYTTPPEEIDGIARCRAELAREGL